MESNLDVMLVAVKGELACRSIESDAL
jgi:hypothetical protein